MAISNSYVKLPEATYHSHSTSGPSGTETWNSRAHQVSLLPLQLLVPEWPVVAPDDRCCSLGVEVFLKQAQLSQSSLTKQPKHTTKHAETMLDIGFELGSSIDSRGTSKMYYVNMLKLQFCKLWNGRPGIVRWLEPMECATGCQISKIILKNQNVST